MDEGKGRLEPAGSAVSERQNTKLHPFGPRRESWKTTLHLFRRVVKHLKATREQRPNDDKLKKTKKDDEKGSISYMLQSV
jgi:hypothetical protein